MVKITKTVISVSGQTLIFEIKKEIEEEIENTKFCPLSETKGIRLRRITMINHVNPIYWSIITDRGFYFCSERDCPVIYFNNSNKTYFGQSDLRVPVMHKMNIRSEERPMCYCMGVVEKQLLDELLVKQCCDSLLDIQEYTGANLGKDCKITNPSGRCCGKQIKEVIEWAKAQRLGISTSLLEEATSYVELITENANKERNIIE